MTATPDPKEQRLLLQAASGDEEAFTALYHQYQHIVERFVVKFVKSHPLAEDIVQEVFIKIWEKRSGLDTIHSFKAYILVIARNHTLNFLKRMAQEEATNKELIRQYAAFRHNPDEALLGKEYQQQLQSILQSLPVQTQKIYALCREQDKNYDEAAQQLGISRNAVKKHMVRANKVFKSSFKQLLHLSIKILFLLLFLK